MVTILMMSAKMATFSRLKKSYFEITVTNQTGIVSWVFLISFKDGGRKVSPKCHFLVFDVIKGRRRFKFKIFLHDPSVGKIFFRSSVSY